MCGICGAIGTSDQQTLRLMTNSLRHRGPDDMGLHIDDGLMLGQCRLSIIDLKTGRQPIYNEDQSIVIVYNGEIYNFREIRRTLESKGHRFSTNSDTEVVVHAYEQYGPESVAMFNGMFAFALYDFNERRLVLARDRQGIKPLYYTVTDDGLVFASEIKSILKHPEIPRILDKNALAYFLTLRYIPLKATMFSGINKILPGHYVVLDQSGFSEYSYWQFRPTPTLDDVPGIQLRKVLKQSVERHMISDVPVGVYLSGGLDSASMVAFASELSEEKIDTFCMGFGEETDELEDARNISKHFNTQHHETIVEDGLLNAFPEMIWHMDFPKRNLYPYYLAQLAHKHVKVVLSGLGGDELFGGYDFRYRPLAEKNPRATKERVAAYLGTQARDVPLDQADVYGDEIPSKIHHCADQFLTPFFDNDLPFMEQVLAADFNAKMTYDFLPVDDATSMAHSVETRVPFLDNEMVDLASKLKFEAKFRDGRGKIVLRMALEGELPSEALTKKKQGFGPNPCMVYKKEVRHYAESYLKNGRAVKARLVNVDWINEVLTKTPSQEFNAEYNKLWDCLALEVFLRIYFDGEIKDSPTWDSI